MTHSTPELPSQPEASRKPVLAEDLLRPVNYADEAFEAGGFKGYVDYVTEGMPDPSEPLPVTGGVGASIKRFIEKIRNK